MSKDLEPIEIDTRIEQIIWKGMGTKSSRQLAEETGLPMERIFAMKRELLDSVDELTLDQKRQKLVVDLQEIAGALREDYNNSPMEFKAGIANAATTAMKTVLAELSRMEKNSSDKITQLNELRKREIVRLYTRVVDTGVVEIAEKYGIPEDELFAVFNNRLEIEATQEVEGEE